MGLAGQKLGSYELIAEIARGSTTDLVLARTRGIAGFERHVVIKRVRDERAGDAAFVEAFVTEARLAATLHHHNVVQVQDINEANGVPYFAMEYVHGEDLRALLAHVHARKEMIPVQHVLTIGCAVAAGLHHAHEQKSPDGKPLNIVHRDVTPANIVVGYDGNVKIVDFGMAKAAITSVTQVGIKKGKAPYMAPEQCAGQRVDRRSDVFALGIVLYELVTARRLFKGASDHDTMMTIVHGSMPPPRVMRPDLPLELSAVITKALARLPTDRFQTAAELGHALETYATSAGIGISTSALAAYLKQQLGERREPWLPGGSVRPPAPVDFDGAELGVASPAGESLPTTPRRDIPTMPAEIAHASAPVVPPSENDHDENEPTAKDGPTKAKAEAAAKSAGGAAAEGAAKTASSAPKKLDPAAFAPKSAPAPKAADAPKAAAAPKPAAAAPLPSITKAAVPTPVAAEESDAWSDVSEPTRVDDDLGDEAATSEMSRDDVAAAIAKPAGVASKPAAAAPTPSAAAAMSKAAGAATIAANPAASNPSASKPAASNPAASKGVGVDAGTSKAAVDAGAPKPGVVDAFAPTAAAETVAADGVVPTRPTPQPVARIALAKAAVKAATDPAAANAPATANATGAPATGDAAPTKPSPVVAAAAARPAAAKPKLPPPSTSKSAPFAKLAPDNDLEIPNESGMRPGTDLEIPTEVGDEPRRPRSDTAEPLPAPPAMMPAPPSTTAETAAGRPARRTKSVSSEMSPVAGGAIVVETRTKTGGDLTLPVTPLPLELPVTTIPDPKGARRRNLVLAGVGGVAVFAAIAAVIAFSGGASDAGAKPAELAQAVEPAKPDPKPPEPEPATAPAGEMTWNGVLDAGAAAAKTPEPAPADVAKQPEPAPADERVATQQEPAPADVAKQPEPAPADEPTTKQPDPAPADKHVAKQPEPSPPDEPVKAAKEPVKAAAVRPVKKPVTKAKPKPAAKPKATKPAEKPADKPVQYDPNSLFLGK